LAHALSHPFSLAFAEGLVGYLHQYRREPGAAQEMGTNLIALSAEHGFTHWLAQGTIMRGWAIAEQGQYADGIAQIEEGLAIWHATSTEALRPHALCLLAEAYRKRADGEQARGLRDSVPLAPSQSADDPSDEVTGFSL
jgi:predicted ATPase